MPDEINTNTIITSEQKLVNRELTGTNISRDTSTLAQSILPSRLIPTDENPFPFPEKPKGAPQSLSLPFCITSHAWFFNSNTFSPKLFNSWSKSNSFQRPFHILLLVKWLIWAVLSISLFSFSIRFIESTQTRIILYAVIGALAFCQTFASLYVMSIDTTDINAKGSTRNARYEKCQGISVINPITGFCNICQVVVGSSTKHCKVFS